MPLLENFTEGFIPPTLTEYFTGSVETYHTKLGCLDGATESKS
jgi:hypothetical protein